ncbi:GGDEF domain-containing protein [Polynucleobacter sinensis]|uniref:GGDEF domain-containing protein n=1 Tax=Polynucleobacter sinensis TaxID=1743157 RepID=UPI000780C09C|nr:GGDEF domain-containing protein [Polynucleobacter sinensis]
MRSKPQSTSAHSIFSKFIAWFSLLAVVLISASSIWTYYNTNQLIRITQERREVALGKGLALAISDLIVTREYAQLESDLRQIMGNESVESVMVTDLNGTVLAYLERKSLAGPVTSNFSIASIDLPKNFKGQFQVEKSGQVSILWYKVDSGIPLGWIRMKTFINVDDALLNNLRMNILLSVSILFFGLFGIAIMLFYRAKQKTQEEELRLINSNGQLHNAAYFDSLTKLPNRLSLNDLVESAMAVAKLDSDLLAICFLDLDGFKGVNDRMGHSSGDGLLVAAAARMKKAVRDSDSVIRLGGDEFVLILGGIKNKEQLEILLKRILELLASPFMISGKNVSVSASIGVTIYPDDDAPMEDLLAHADAAMYEAKKQGKNAWVLSRNSK